MTSRYGTAIVRGVAAVEVDADDLRDARFLHGDAVDHVGLRHRAFAVSDHHELCRRAHLVDQFGEAAYVGLVERGVDFVENAEGGRLELEDTDKKRECGEGLFSSGEQEDVLQLL